MSDKITPQQIELITELCSQNKVPVPPNLKAMSAKEGLDTIRELRVKSHNPSSYGYGGFDHVPNFNY